MNKIFLREITRADLPIINAWRSDRSIAESLGGPIRYVGLEVDEKWFDAYLAARENTVRLAICTEEGAVLIGVVYLLHIDWINRAAEFAIQIGDARMQGQGIGLGATRKMLQHAFLDLNLQRVYLSVLADNVRAIRLYQKSGFSEEGCARRAIYRNGEYKDASLMAILREEFLAMENK